MRAFEHIDGNPYNNDLANLRIVEISQNNITGIHFRWEVPTYAKRGSCEVFDLPGMRYCVKRKVKSSREFYVLRNGTAICEAPSLQTGKTLAEGHAKGEWK